MESPKNPTCSIDIFTTKRMGGKPVRDTHGSIACMDRPSDQQPRRRISSIPPSKTHHSFYNDISLKSYSMATTSTSSQLTNLNTAGVPITPSSIKSHPLSLSQIRVLKLDMTHMMHIIPIMILFPVCTTYPGPPCVTRFRFPAAAMQCSASRLITPVCGFCTAMFFGIL